MKLLVCLNLFLGDIGEIFIVKFACNSKRVFELEVFNYEHKFMFVGSCVEKCRKFYADDNNDLLLEQQSQFESSSSNWPTSGQS